MLAKRVGRQLQVALRESQMPLWQLAKRAGVDVTEAAAALGGNLIVPAQVLDTVAQAMGLELSLVPASPAPRQVGQVPSVVDNAIEPLMPGCTALPPGELGISVLALGFEGTLILDADTPIARPGLLEFLQCARGLFQRIVVFTALPGLLFRKLALLLTTEGEAPEWFGSVEHIHWRGPYKDLGCILEASLRQTVLLDRDDAQVHPDQVGQWIRITPFKAPVSDEGEELHAALQALVDRLTA